jgi:PKD repeat protein
MHKQRALWVALGLVAVALAGCSSGSSSDFTVKAPADSLTQPFEFTAQTKADSYTWHFGDGQAPKTGKTVEHLYGARAGNVTVTLLAESGGETKTYTKTITLGTGANQKAAFVLESGSNWAEVGETVRFSAARSSDPDGDTLYYSWNCIFQGELKAAGGHAHGGGGAPIGGDPTSRVAVQVSNGTLPNPDRVVSGDFCDNARGDGYFAATATVEGSFSKPGVYRIVLLAKDAATPSISGYYDLVVSPAGERPDRVFSASFDGTFMGGRGGGFQEINNQLGLNYTLDKMVLGFRLALPAKNLWINFTHGNPETSEVTWTMKKGSKVLEQDATESKEYANPSEFLNSDYTLEVVLQQGAQTPYSLSVQAIYDMDPEHKYELH